MSVVDNERPPYITFERRALEDRAESVKTGHYVSKDVDFVTITRPGSRDTIEKEALVWLAECRVHVKNQRMPASWLTAFQTAYEQWRTGETIPDSGTPIKGWPVLSPAAQKDLLHAGIRTVEDLATMPDQDLQLVCMGALTFKLKAKSWLDAAKDTGKLVEQLTSLTQNLSTLQSVIDKQAEEIKRLTALVPQDTPAKAAKGF